MSTNRFQSKQDQIKKQLENKETRKSSIKIPKIEKEEKRLPFTFTLKSSARRKLDKLAKESGYNSTSKFLNDLIENL